MGSEINPSVSTKELENKVSKCWCGKRLRTSPEATFIESRPFLPPSFFSFLCPLPLPLSLSWTGLVFWNVEWSSNGLWSPQPSSRCCPNERAISEPSVVITVKRTMMLSILRWRSTRPKVEPMVHPGFLRTKMEKSLEFYFILQIRSLNGNGNFFFHNRS